MVELGSQDGAGLGREMSGSQEINASPTDRKGKDRLLIAILGTASFLAILIWGTMVFWGTGPVLTSVPWYIPLVSSFISLIAFLVGYLALGRYQVLRDPVSFWVGSGYLVYGLGQIFYVFSWPGLLPDGEAVLGRLPGTSSWITLVSLTLLEVFLLAAVLNPWPNRFSLPGNRWLKPVLAFVLVATLFFGVSILLESFLPVLVDENGVFTLFQRGWVALLLCLFVPGSLYSILYYRRSRDRLVGFIVFPQMALAFVCMMVLIGGRRYDLWWYVQRVVVVGGHLGVLYGLLSQYVHLLKRESEGRRMLEAILENIPVGLAVTGGPPDYPIVRISRHGLEVNGQESDTRIGSQTVADPAQLKIFLSSQDSEISSLEKMPLYRASHSGERDSEYGIGNGKPGWQKNPGPGQCGSHP